MSKPATPDGTKPDMTKNKAKSQHETLLPQEMASAVNLMAHPMAGVAAMGALGLGVASHTVGLWLGTVAGAAEATRRLMLDGEEATRPAPERRPARLRLVASAPVAEPVGAAVRTMIAEAEIAARKTADVVSKAVDEAVADAVPAMAKPASAKASRPARKAAPLAPAKVADAPKTPAAARPAAIEKPARPDDLKAISGIGPKLETVLNGFGIWTYAQIAALSSAEVGWLDNELGFAGRIGRDDWIGQARALVGGTGA